MWDLPSGAAFFQNVNDQGGEVGTGIDRSGSSWSCYQQRKNYIKAKYVSWVMAFVGNGGRGKRVGLDPIL